ncbi:hypothetical protein [Afifella pfennigii]|uniref:hypothetical protein n=1 Tax=Afifella pfennigii TaxID=209897 RepID=UPI00068957F3|nr:hypothetical protein [Afifella pfennigii]
MRAAVFSLAGLLLALPADAKELRAAGYSFSDELGGFRLIAVAGAGSRADPFVIREALFGIGPVTLTIRRPGMPPGSQIGRWNAVHIRKVVENRSGRVWAGFDMELQERRDVPSIYGDGLSFDQGRLLPVEIGSDVFARHDRRFEPYDRLRFSEGYVDPAGQARFSLHITDPTPTAVFYLVQQPQILFASKAGGPRLAAASLPLPPPPAP